MTMARDHARAKIERAASRLAQMQAREALLEMRRQSTADARAKRLEARRRFEMGQAIDDAGLGSWSKAEVTGLLLRAKDKFGDSSLTRSMLAAHAKELLEAPSTTSQRLN